MYSLWKLPIFTARHMSHRHEVRGEIFATKVPPKERYVQLRIGGNSLLTRRNRPRVSRPKGLRIRGSRMRPA